MITIKINNPDEAGKTDLKKIAKIISEGKITILPASTIYGLSCRYDSKNSIEKIYKIKKRGKNIPLIILISGKDDLKKLASSINRTAEKIIEKFWDIKKPRPLTLIFKRNSSLENFVTCGSSNIALRLAGSGFLRDIISILIVECSSPLAGEESTIINVTGRVPFLVREGAVKFKEILNNNFQ